MITLVRTTSDNTDFIGLVTLLDAELSIRDGEDHSFYAQFNQIDTIRHEVSPARGSLQLHTSC